MAVSGHGRALPHQLLTDLALVISEIATNSLEATGSGGVLRIRPEPGGLTWEIRGLGRTDDAALLGLLPPGPHDARGLWLARQLCEYVHVWPDGRHTGVRASLTAR
jgi:anti-sigma regulatory factor (Ser/Thr protein kinase)